MAGEPIWFWWPVRRRGRQCLNSGFLIIGDRHHWWLFQRTLYQSLVGNLHFFVNVQDLDHLTLEFRIPALHVVADPVRFEFALGQDSVEFGTAQSPQVGMTGFDAVLPYVLLEQRIRPEFVGVAQLFRLLT